MFRFSHLSDIHLTPMPPPNRRDLASKRITGYLNWTRKRQFELSRALLDAIVDDAKAQSLNHLAITGDLVNLATDAEIEAARLWLSSIGNPKDVALVCGNHDSYVAGALETASDRWDVWLDGDDAEFSGHGPAPNWRSFDARYPLVQQRGSVAFVNLSSAAPSRPFAATGLVSRGQSQRLKALLQRLDEEGLCRVVLIHHPPQAKATPRAKRLIAAHRVRRAIGEAGAELVLHGHTHRDTITAISGPNGTEIPVVCVPAAGQLPGHRRPPGRHNMYEITGSKSQGWNIALQARGITNDASPQAPFQIQMLFKRIFAGKHFCTENTGD